MIKVLIKFWPVLIPFAIFIIWYFKHKKKVSGESKKKIRNERIKAFSTATICSFLIALVMVIIGMLFNTQQRGEVYVPPKFKDGKIIPAHSE